MIDQQHPSAPAIAKPFALSGSRVVEQLHSSLKTGLSSEQALERQAKWGANELVEESSEPWWYKLTAQFNNYLVWILLVGAVVSITAGELVDGALIMAIVVFMALLGYIQDAKAEEALKNLKKLEAATTRVLREGELQEIETKLVVPGDIVHLKAGDALPADIRIIEAQNVSINESTLTGESLPVSKHNRELAERVPLAERQNMAYSGTLLLAGTLVGVVTATGMHTELGTIATLLTQTKTEPTPLELQLESLGKLLSIVLICLVGCVLLLNVVVRRQPLLESFLESVALAVAAVPEGLPAVITICLAFGTQAMVKKQALVRKLKAVEALGSISVIFTDKTGTITTGNMSVTDVWTPDALIRHPARAAAGANPLLGLLVRAAALCNTRANPTDQALYDWSASIRGDSDQLEKIFEYEFSSTLKRMTTVHELPIAHAQAHEHLIITKGAPEIVLRHITRVYTSATKSTALTPSTAAAIEKQIHLMASRGLRVLAFAQRVEHEYRRGAKRTAIESELSLIGLVGLSDPAKAEVPAAIAATKQAGIRPIMMTGDNPITAKTIALEVGLLSKEEAAKPDCVMTGEQIDQAVADHKFERIMQANVFARVSPAHKSILVDTFQNAGFLVAMVGDGVNDAPSIKAAHVGVAMGQRGSDVTKSAADLVLLDDNYSTLVDAIAEGRTILHRIRLFIGYLLSCNFAEIGIFVVATLIGVPMPLTAIMLLLINVVTDAAPAVALSREPTDPTLMSQPPRPTGESIITRPMWLNIALMTIATTAAVMAAYFIALRTGGVLMAETVAFVTLSGTELFRAFTARSLRKTIWQIGPFSNPWIPGAVLLSTTVTLVVVYLGSSLFGMTPLPASLLLTAAAFALIAPLVEEAFKWASSLAFSDLS